MTHTLLNEVRNLIGLLDPCDTCKYRHWGGEKLVEATTTCSRCTFNPVYMSRWDYDLEAEIRGRREQQQ